MFCSQTSVVLLLLQMCAAVEFDPTKFDYCSHTCPSGEGKEHTACKCTILEGDREEIVESFMDFRIHMIELHNTYRNKLARGEENETFKFPSAADMLVFNYDLELEFIARCYGKRAFRGDDTCRNTHDMTRHVGQNLDWSAKEPKPPQYNSTYKQLLKKWYDEIKFVANSEIVDSFSESANVLTKPGLEIGHFSQVIWASCTKVGCARVSIPMNPVNRDFRFLIICNYAGSENGFCANFKGKPIYTKGEPCSKCPVGVKCNREYGGKWDALCGESEKIPTHVPYNKVEQVEIERTQPPKKQIEEDDETDDAPLHFLNTSLVVMSIAVLSVY